MKKVLLLIASAFMFLNVNASNVERIEYANAGDFSLGIMIGVPPYGGANMPTISVDGMWGLTDGFIHTKTFGDNGAIDLGGYIGYCHYGDSYDYGYYGYHYDHYYWELPILVRCGFHFEFVKHLDVYAGFQGGICLEHWRNELEGDRYDVPGYEIEENGSHVDGVFGSYIGAKWHFNDNFGVKLEFSSDWIGDGNDLPGVAGGVTFNF